MLSCQHKKLYDLLYHGRIYHDKGKAKLILHSDPVPSFLDKILEKQGKSYIMKDRNAGNVTVILIKYSSRDTLRFLFLTRAFLFQLLLNSPLRGSDRHPLSR